MRILLDEDVPEPALELLRHVLRGHDVRHVRELKWTGKKDRYLYRDAAKAGFDVVVTNDQAQLSDPDETRAIKESRVHRVAYAQRNPGLTGLAVAVASLVAAMPFVIEELAKANTQRLVYITGIDPTRRRYKIEDPRRDPPRYWPR